MSSHNMRRTQYRSHSSRSATVDVCRQKSAASHQSFYSPTAEDVKLWMKTKNKFYKGSNNIQVFILYPLEILLLDFRGCTEEWEMKTMEQKPEPEPLAAGYRPSPRSTWRWDSPSVPPGLHSTPNPQRWTPMGPPPPPLPRSHKALMPVPYREPQHLNSKRWDSELQHCIHF